MEVCSVHSGQIGDDRDAVSCSSHTDKPSAEFLIAPKSDVRGVKRVLLKACQNLPGITLECGLVCGYSSDLFLQGHFYLTRMVRPLLT